MTLTIYAQARLHGQLHDAAVTLHGEGNYGDVRTECGIEDIGYVTKGTPDCEDCTRWPLADWRVTRQGEAA